MDLKIGVCCCRLSTTTNMPQHVVRMTHQNQKYKELLFVCIWSIFTWPRLFFINIRSWFWYRYRGKEEKEEKQFGLTDNGAKMICFVWQNYIHFANVMNLFMVLHTVLNLFIPHPQPSSTTSSDGRKMERPLSVSQQGGNQARICGSLERSIEGLHCVHILQRCSIIRLEPSIMTW